MSDGQELVKLVSREGVEFKVPKKVACVSATLHTLIEDAGTDNPIPLPNVTDTILEKVIEYCAYHADTFIQTPEDVDREKRTDNIIPWDLEFCQVDQPTLFNLILTANYLDIRPLLELCCKIVANMIKGKSPEEIRATFNIKDPFTAEEIDQVKKENDWIGDVAPPELASITN